MARAIWSGAIAFGLVNIPVKLFPATESKDVSFTTLHAADNTPLRRPYICPKDNMPVTPKDMVKAYEYAKGQYVLVTEEDLDRIPLETSKAIEVAGFVDAEEVPILHRERNYFIAPIELSVKPFELFRQALVRTGKIAIARAVLWRKEQLVALSPFDGALTLTTLMYADEVHPPPDIPAPQPVTVNDAEIDLAIQLIKALSMDFDPSRYQDRYREYLMQLIRAKVEGKEMPAVAKPEARPTEDLMSALRASLEATKAG